MNLQNLKKFAPWALVLLCLASALYAWYRPKQEIRLYPEYIDRTKTIIKRVPVPVEGGAVQGTGETVQGNPVVAKADCPPAPNGSDVISTVTPSTGEVHILVKPKPRSLFGFEDAKELGVRYNGIQAGIYGRWTFVRVGNFYGALYGEADTQPHAFAGVEISYHW